MAGFDAAEFGRKINKKLDLYAVAEPEHTAGKRGIFEALESAYIKKMRRAVPNYQKNSALKAELLKLANTLDRLYFTPGMAEDYLKFLFGETPRITRGAVAWPTAGNHMINSQKILDRFLEKLGPRKIDRESAIQFCHKLDLVGARARAAVSICEDCRSDSDGGESRLAGLTDAGIALVVRAMLTSTREIGFEEKRVDV